MLSAVLPVLFGMPFPPRSSVACILWMHITQEPVSCHVSGAKKQSCLSCPPKTSTPLAKLGYSASLASPRLHWQCQSKGL